MNKKNRGFENYDEEEYNLESLDKRRKKEGLRRHRKSQENNSNDLNDNNPKH